MIRRVRRTSAPITPARVAGLFFAAIVAIAGCFAADESAAMDHAATATDFVPFTDLSGWTLDNHGAALAAYQRSCRWLLDRQATGAVKPAEQVYLAVCAKALQVDAGNDQAARLFFERHFHPVRPTGASPSGFVTGYYEPLVTGSRVPTDHFSVPLYRRPPDLVKIDDESRPESLPAGFRFARRLPDGSLVMHPDRQAIETGALAGRGLELVWLHNPVDAFFIHVQGSARIQLTDGTIMRVGFDGKSGHPYTAIGKVLVDAGELTLEEATMDGLRAWFAENPDRVDDILHRNQSFIFFRQSTDGENRDGPVAAGGVPLTAGRSLAVDRSLYPFLMPVWIAGQLPVGPGDETKSFSRLMIAQDTGSAIIGPARGDIFFGSGPEAGAIAGRVRHPVDFVILQPRDQPGEGG